MVAGLSSAMFSPVFMPGPTTSGRMPVIMRTAGDERAVDRRHDGRQDRPVDILRRNAGKLDHLPQRDRILVRGLITVGLQTGNVADARRIEKTDHNVCIANVQSQKHISPPDPSCRLRSAG